MKLGGIVFIMFISEEMCHFQQNLLIFMGETKDAWKIDKQLT